MRYQHYQRAPLCLIFYSSAAAMLCTLGTIPWPSPAVPWSIGIGLVLFILLGLAFQHLLTQDYGERLLIAFGPLPLFWRTVAYADIVSATADRTTFFDGWGIHLSPRGGWVWNLWGFDCVRIQFRNGTLWVGTNDPHGLAAFLQSQLTPAAPTATAAEPPVPGTTTA